MDGYYARVLFDFSTSERGEISLRCGEIVFVTHQVDANWLCGQIASRIGNFPKNFVEKVHIPKIQDGQKNIKPISILRPSI